MPENLKQTIYINNPPHEIPSGPEILYHFKPISLQQMEEQNYYIHTSNLAYISKLVEKSIALQDTDHAIEHRLCNLHLSVCKQLHSTETVILKVHNDVMCTSDQGKAVALVLLDLSAAFAMVDYDICVHRLHTHLGISSIAIDWFG